MYQQLSIRTTNKITIRFILFAALVILFFRLSAVQAQSSSASLDATLSLKEVDGLMIPYQNGTPLPSFEKQYRDIIDLQGQWKKERFAADDEISLAKRDSAGYQALLNEAGGRNSAAYDDSGWEIKTLPAVENQMYAYPTVPEYYEDGVWYRKSFDLGAIVDEQFVKLNFYAVNYVADVWLNDVYLGYHEGGYTPFSFDVSKALNYGGPNVLVVRVDNPRWGFRNDIVPYIRCDWFNYTGIIHDVYLEFSHQVSVIRNDIVPLDTAGTVQSTLVIKNKEGIPADIDVTFQVFEALTDSQALQSEFSDQLISGNMVTESQTSLSVPTDSVKVWRTELFIPDPKLWKPKEPNLYVMKVILKRDNQTIDQFSSQFGIRTVRADGNKVLLNDKVVFLTGTARHEDHPVYGRSIPKEIIFSDLEKVKSSNVNLLRTAHYPNHPYTYLVADRLGLTVVEEIPVWWFDTEAAWQIQNNVRHIHQQMFREMVFKDYNRPSILLWSTSNECLDVPNRKIFIETVHNDLNTNYPDGRLITQSAAADRPGPADDSQQACDVAGWTMYFGIFHGSTYFQGTYLFLTNAQASFPGKPIIDTEFGYWSSEDNSSEQEQVNVFNNTFIAFQQFSALDYYGKINANGALLTCTWWCIFDWYSHQHSRGFQSMGLYSMDRSRAKPVAEVLKNAYAHYYEFDGVSSINEDDQPDSPVRAELLQNYSNPFNASTVISYHLPAAGHVRLEVYNSAGQKIASLIDGYQSGGTQKLHFDGSELSSGVYFYRIEVSAMSGNQAKYTEIKKMVLIK